MKIKWLNGLLDLFYPKQCLLCETPLIDGERHICLSCIDRLPVTDYHARKNNPTAELLAGYAQIKEASSFLYFEKSGIAQHLIHSFKYHGDTALAEYLGRMAAVKYNERGVYASIDAIVPVPLHPKKKKSRGYNQCEHIAKGFSSIYACPVENGWLARTVETATQTNKSVYERRVNVDDIFRVTDVEPLCGKHILLVDDVMTTGATLSACIDALRLVPQITVSVFTLAIAREY